MTTVKITELTDIGANLATSTVVPVVNMAGTPTTQKTNIGNIANIILEGAGVDYPEASVALLAQTVSNAAQPNITSVGTLTSLAVSGNASVNGNLTSNGTAYLGNISTTGSATITTLVVGTSANLGAVGNVRITGGTSGQILSTDGAGNLSWVSDANGGSYGNSNVVSLLSAFGSNTITTTGNVSVGNIIGNGQALTNIAGANVSGFVPNANVANTAFAVAAANVSGLGNIATINLTGSTSNVLYGNGVFAAVAGGANTGNVTFSNQIVLGTGSNDGTGGLYLAPGNASIANSAVQYLRVRGGDFPTHIHLDTGNNAYYDQYFGNDNKFVKLEAGDAGNVVIGTDDTTGNLYNWTFTSDGNFILANGNSVIKSIANSSLDPVNPNVSTMVLTPDPGYSTQSLVLDPTAPGHIHLRAPGANIDEPSANIFLGGEDSSFEVGYYNGSAPNVFVHSGGNTWTFDTTGNLSVPNNINFNGGSIQQVQNEDLYIRVSDEENDGWSLYNTVDDGLGNVYSSTQLDSDGLAINTDVSGTGYEWTFDSQGRLNLPGNIQGVYGGNTSFYAYDDGTNGTVEMKVISYIGDNLLSNVTVSNPNVTISTSNVAYTWTFGDDGRLTFPGTPRIDTSTNNFEVQAAEAINFEANTAVNIYTDAGNNAYQWNFGDDGKTTLPTISLGSGINEQTVIQSQRKIIPSNRYSAVISGTTPTVVYTANDSLTNSMKVTLQLQHQNLGMEFFEVYATQSSNNTYYTVSNRLQPPTIDSTDVTVTLNGSNEMQITLTVNSGATTCWVTYDSTEFGIPQD